MNKLIIGCGFLGHQVARLWLEAGHLVWATTRSPQRTEEFRLLGLQPLVCDVLDPVSLEALPVVDTVLYCVGMDRTSGRTMREVYVRGLTNVLDQLSKPGRGCRKFLYVSSTSVYGQTGGEWVDETAGSEPRTEAGRIVLQAESALRNALPGAVVLRFAGIYGPGRLIRAETLKTGTPVTGDPDKWLNLIHVGDGAAAVVAADEHAVAGGIYNVCDDVPVPRGEFYLLLAELMGVPPPRFVPLDQPQAVSSHSSHDATHRRISNRSMKKLLPVLKYPSYREGLPACAMLSRPSKRLDGST